MNDSGPKQGFRKMRGAWAQPRGVLSEEHANSVLPLINMDREWDQLRRTTHIYLATAFGLSLLTCGGFIAEFEAQTPREVTQGVLSATMMFGVGLVAVAAAFVLDLWAGWFSMRNRKRMLAGEPYFVGFFESLLSLSAGLILVLSAISFGAIVGFVIFTVWTTDFYFP